MGFLHGMTNWWFWVFYGYGVIVFDRFGFQAQDILTKLWMWCPLDVFRDLLPSCSNCGAAFDVRTRSPCVLPCGHSFCMSCLNTEAQQKEKRCLDRKCLQLYVDFHCNSIFAETIERVQARRDLVEDVSVRCDECGLRQPRTSTRRCMKCVQELSIHSFNGVAIDCVICLECCVNAHSGHHLVKVCNVPLTPQSLSLNSSPFDSPTTSASLLSTSSRSLKPSFKESSVSGSPSLRSCASNAVSIKERYPHVRPFTLDDTHTFELNPLYQPVEPRRMLSLSSIQVQSNFHELERRPSFRKRIQRFLTSVRRISPAKGQGQLKDSTEERVELRSRMSLSRSATHLPHYSNVSVTCHRLSTSSSNEGYEAIKD